VQAGEYARGPKIALSQLSRWVRSRRSWRSCASTVSTGLHHGIPQMTRRLDNKPRSIGLLGSGELWAKITHTLECASEEADGLG
jgi:hypothetical protein